MASRADDCQVLQFCFHSLLCFAERKAVNYSATPVLDVRFTLNFLFTEIVRDKANPNAKAAGQMTGQYSDPITIPKVDPGKDNTFVFYAINVTDELVQLSIPLKASLTVLGSGQRQDTQISGAAGRKFLLYPR